MDQDFDIGKELDTKIKIPKDVREKIYTKVFKEFGIAILVFAYFIFLNFIYSKMGQDVFTNCLNCFSGILICATVILFEIGYRKNSGEFALHGTEVLIVSIVTLFMPYVYFRRSTTFMMLYSLAGFFIAIYYSIKALVVYVNEVRKYKAGLSDIKEIMTEENESFLDEVSKRKFENVDDSFNRSEQSVLRKRDRIKQTLSRIAHSRKKVETGAEEVVEEFKDLETENDVTNEKVDMEKPKRRRGRARKKSVPSLATASRKKRKAGENND